MDCASVQDEYQFALHSFHDGNFQDAKKHFRNCIRQDINLKEVYAILGKIYQIEGNLPKSIAMYREAVRLGNEQPDCHSGLGESLFEARRYEEAGSVLTQVCQTNTDHLGAHLNLGRLLIETGRYLEAIALLDGISKKHPTDEDVFHLMGVAFFCNQEFKQAINVLKQAIANEPEHNPHTYLLLGRVYLALDYVDLAIEFFRRSAKIYPVAEMYYPAAKAYQRRQKFKTSLKLYDKALSLSTNEGRRDEILFNQGEILFELGEEADRRGEKHDYYDQAVRAFQRALEVNPGFHAAQHHLAIVYMKCQAIQEAESLFRELIDSPPDTSTSPVKASPIIPALDSRFLPLVHMAYTLSLGNKHEDAISMLEKALRMPEVQAEPVYKCRILRRLGVILLEVGDYKKAADVWRELQQLDDDNFYQSRDFMAETLRLIEQNKVE